MKKFNNIKGQIGEIAAQKYLKKKGYKLLATNERNSCGEIDIIAQKAKTIVFVEVKYRLTVQFGLPREAVTKAKQEKIRNAAALFLEQNKLTDRQVRFDVIEIIGDELHHIEGCF